MKRIVKIMKYLTGIFALNIEDSLETCGDWHTSAMDWNKITLEESDNTIFKDYGIEINKSIPEHDEKYNVANTLRAVLDLMINNKLKYLKGFRNDFFCTDKYNNEFFSKVIQLRNLDNWEEINHLMKYEFFFEWTKYIKECEVNERLEDTTRSNNG
jgi:hypothetical protein